MSAVVCLPCNPPANIAVVRGELVCMLGLLCRVVDAVFKNTTGHARMKDVWSRIILTDTHTHTYTHMTLKHTHTHTHTHTHSHTQLAYVWLQAAVRFSSTGSELSKGRG